MVYSKKEIIFNHNSYIVTVNVYRLAVTSNVHRNFNTNSFVEIQLWHGTHFNRTRIHVGDAVNLWPDILTW